MSVADLLSARIHIQPGASAAASPFSTPPAAMRAVSECLWPLPPRLITHWLAQPGGHIILNSSRHEFAPGLNTFRQQDLLDVAWLRLDDYPDRLRFLLPVGAWLVHLLGWGSDQETEPTSWIQFVSGVESCFRAGYGVAPAAQEHVEVYLAEGLAAYLADRHALNLRDPRLEKLLAAMVFAEAAPLVRDL